MSRTSPHNKIINAVARAKLRPLGIQQKGRFRFWYEDRRWYGIAIEFQPSGFSKMSYLNAGISWFWYPKDHWSLDFGDREPVVVEFNGDEAQFQKDCEALVDQAIDAIDGFRLRAATLEDAYRSALEQQEQITRPGGWPYVHLGLLAGLNCQPDQAADSLRYVANQACRTEADRDLKEFCDQAISRLERIADLRDWVESNIVECRSLRGLPPP